MSGWLMKASQALSRRAPAEPQPYAVECLCGQTLSGLRQPQAQRPVCDSCGRACFVLPIDVYPTSEPAKPNKPKKAKRRARSQPAEPIAEAAPVAPAAPPSPAPPVPQQPARPAQPVEQEDDLGSAVRPVSDARPRPVYPRKRLFTPFRLVVLCLAAVVCSTGFWVVHRRSLDRAELAWTEARETGLAALREGDFLAAARDLQIACEALDLLGRHDRAAQEIRQLRDEAQAASFLCSVSLFEIAQSAEQMHDPGDGKWKDHFDSRFRGTWVVLDAYVARAPTRPEQAESDDERPEKNRPSSARFVVDYPLSIGEQPVEIELVSSALEKLGVGDEPRRTIFAAQLESCSPAAGNWLIRLRPQTAFLWSNPANYEALGFPIEPNVAQLLEQQTQAMESAGEN